RERLTRSRALRVLLTSNDSFRESIFLQELPLVRGRSRESPFCSGKKKSKCNSYEENSSSINCGGGIGRGQRFRGTANIRFQGPKRGEQRDIQNGRDSGID